MKKNEIKVSVVIPTYNTDEEILMESVNSILKQTHKNFELIIIDDGSKVKSLFLENITDSRVIVVYNGENKGLVYTLNRGIEISSGKYFFRMDADDIALPNRLEVSIKFLEKNPSIGILGTNVIYFGNKKGKSRFPRKHDDIKSNLIFSNVIAHPSVVYRKEVIDKYKLRYSSKYLSEDYHMWLNVLINYPDIKFATLKNKTLKYRIHDAQITSAKKQQLFEDGIKLQQMIMEYIGIDLTFEEHNSFYMFSTHQKLSKKEVRVAFEVLKKIITTNKSRKIFKHNSLKKSIRIKTLKNLIIQIIRFKNFRLTFVMLRFVCFLIGR